MLNGLLAVRYGRCQANLKAKFEVDLPYLFITSSKLMLSVKGILQLLIYLCFCCES